MVLRPRTRPLLRRAVAAAALGALLVPAVADAKAKPKTPVITKVTPTTALVGTKLTITGKYFLRGKGKNSVLFRRDKGKALFVKADVSTTKKLTVVLPQTLEKYMNAQGATPIATRFRVRVLASQAQQGLHLGQDVAADRAGEGQRQRRQLRRRRRPDGARRRLRRATASRTASTSTTTTTCSPTRSSSRSVLDPCSGDTDGDGVEDGFEYQSAIDLNNDDYQDPNYSIPYPAKTAVPEPAVQGRRHGLRRRRPGPGRGVQALEVHVRGQPHRDAYADPAVLLRRPAVLALGALRR